MRMMRFHPVLGMLALAGVLVGNLPGGTQWPSQLYAQDLPAPKLEVTAELDRAVERGLDYLASSQQEDGSWSSDSYGRVSGIVGVAMMAFLARGHTPDDPKYGHVIRRAVNYIVSTQQSNGLLSGNGGSPMYSHGFATLALAEVYGQIDDPRVGPALEKAAGLLVSCQNTQGGWRYSVGSQDSDTTVTGAQMMALRAAASGGIAVPIETIRKAVGYYKYTFCSGGGFGYTHPSGPNMPRSGIGMLILCLSGQYRSSEVRATADWIYGRIGADDSGYLYYMTYYCSQAMFQAGGKYWRRWNEVMTPMIMSRQSPDGSWSGNSHSSGGIVGATAFALLSIELNYNLLPIYQR